MYITWSTIITAASFVTALGVLIGLILKVHKWYLEMNELREEIKKIKAHHKEDVQRINEENKLVCFALSAALDGLIQLGANHNVPIAKEKLDKYLNNQAHE